MPINSGRKGFAGLVAVPALRRRSGLDPEYSTGGGPMGSGILRAGARARPFRSPDFATSAYAVTGVTRDASGTPLGNVNVTMYLTGTDAVVARTVSDGSGNFSFPATAGPYYLVFYKLGTPDVFGSSVNTLAGQLL